MVSWPWPWVIEPDTGSPCRRGRSGSRLPRSRPPRRARSCWRGRCRAICRAGVPRARRLSKPAASASFERHVEVLFELAAIVGEGQARFERHRLGRDRIAPAQFDRVDAHLGGGLVDHPLDDIARLGPAVAAIGPHRVGVGEDRGHLGMDRRGALDPGQGAEIVDKGIGAGLRIGADGGDRLDPQAEEIAVLVERQLGFGDVVAACASPRKPRTACSSI